MIPVFWQLNDYEGTDPDHKIAKTEAGQTPQQIATSNQYSMVGAMYFITFMQMLLNFLPTVIIFQGEKPIFVRERAANMYDIWVYATTKMFAEIPIMLYNPLLLLVLAARSRTKIGFSPWKIMTVGKKLSNICMKVMKYMAPTMEYWLEVAICCGVWPASVLAIL
jgi:hypothetical protein